MECKVITGMPFKRYLIISSYCYFFYLVPLLNRTLLIFPPWRKNIIEAGRSFPVYVIFFICPFLHQTKTKAQKKNLLSAEVDLSVEVKLFLLLLKQVNVADTVLK